MTEHRALQGRGAHAIRTRIMVFREVLTIFIKVNSGSAPGTHVDVVGAVATRIRSYDFYDPIFTDLLQQN